MGLIVAPPISSQCARKAKTSYVLQRMDVDALLASPSRVEHGGVRSLSEREDLCFDVPALAAALQRRCVGVVHTACLFYLCS